MNLTIPKDLGILLFWVFVQGQIALGVGPAGTPGPRFKPTHTTPVVSAPVIHQSLPPELQEVEKKYAQSEVFSASFVQKEEIPALKQNKESSGTLLFKRPDKIKWEQLKPTSSLLISNGKTFWFYTPPFAQGESGQVVVQRSSQKHSKLMNALLSGRFSKAGEFLQFENLGNERFRLTISPGSAGTVKSAEIEIHPTDHLIEKVTLFHENGNKAEISLSDFRLNLKIEDSVFEFKIPPNTDRVTE